MRRKHQLQYIYSGMKPLKNSLSSKQALMSTTNELKQMLGPKLEKIKKSMNKYQQHRINMIQGRKDQCPNKETNKMSVLEDLTFDEANQNNKDKQNIPKIHRYSHRFLATSVTRRTNNENTANSLNKKYSGQAPMNKYSSVRHNDIKKASKQPALTNIQHYAIKKRYNHMNSNAVLSASLGKQLKREENRSYYVMDLKGSVSEFKNNEEYMDAHLTHFMESISAFKMFGCSYLPQRPHRTVQLPEISKNKMTLVFDMDQTLIHTQILHEELASDEIGWGKTVEIVTEDGKYRVNLRIRPHAIEVLQRLSESFQIGVLTAGQEHYANKLLDELDPEGKLFSFRLFRPHCLEMYSRVPYVKDLRVLGNRDLSKVVLIDNSPHSYMFQKRNGIPIISFYEDKDDTELLKLETFLLTLSKTSDVRKYLHDYFRFEDYNRFGCMNKIVEQLY